MRKVECDQCAELVDIDDIEEGLCCECRSVDDFYETQYCCGMMYDHGELFCRSCGDPL